MQIQPPRPEREWCQWQHSWLPPKRSEFESLLALQCFVGVARLARQLVKLEVTGSNPVRGAKSG